MQVTETASEGLSRQFKVVVPAGELTERLDKKLGDLAPQVRLNGFRPGKVPVSFLKKTYGKSMMGEVVQEALNETSAKAIEEREIRVATQPRVEVQSTVADVVAGKADLEYTIQVDVMPDFEPADIKALAFEKLTAEVTEADIDEQLKRLADAQRSYKARAKTAKARAEDQVTIDFEGKVDGEVFEGGKGTDVKVVLGQGRLLKEFEEQLEGAKAGEDREIKLTFPKDYGSPELAGKDAVFQVLVKEVAGPEDVAIDEEFAKKLGIESLEKLREAMKERIAQDYGRMTRAKLKRTILDKLDEAHSFELPSGMVATEFNQIWAQVEPNLEQEKKAESKSEDEIRADYRKIAERRVRLGLVLAEIGKRGEVQVTQEELARAIGEQARRLPGQEQQVYKFYRENPGALDQLRAPLFEDKVIDFISEMAKVEARTISKDELMKEMEALESFDAHLHDHDHDHDHDHAGHDHAGHDHDHDHDHAGHDHDHGETKPKKPRAKKKKAE